MSPIDSRTLVAFVTGAGLMLAGGLAGAAVAGQAQPSEAPSPAKVQAIASSAPAAPLLITSACANKKTGVVTVKAKKHKKCTKAEKAVRFATPAKSVLGSDGSLTLTKGMRITSANGQYVLVVNDLGVGLQGPGGTVLVDAFRVTSKQSRRETP
ncbi:hypothetical protein [Nocardioides sp.]|uniref:hypothetical protein n=1 Tax=Nocardioides sp. TaxID=35761 RepID=UPI003561EB0D